MYKVPAKRQPQAGISIFEHYAAFATRICRNVPSFGDKRPISV